MNNRLILLIKYLNSISLNKESSEIRLLVKEAASKVNALKKLGFSDVTAKEIDDICKGFSMWIAYRLISHVSQPGSGINDKAEAIKYLDDNFRKFKPKVSYIMDWVKVGLDGEYQEYKETSLDDLYGFAKKWHDSLDAGDGDINYQERNNIILDFRQPDGTGFYWADLNTNRSDEECNRMGHCGTTRYGNNILSLRKFVPIGKGFTLNKSVLTAAITSDGKIAQLKGPKNSNPDQAYHKYIIPLLNLKKSNEDGEESSVITGFRPEYYSDADFSLSDLSDEEYSELITTNPSIISGISGRIEAAKRADDLSMLRDISSEILLSNRILEKIITTGRNSISVASIIEIIEDPSRMFSFYENYAANYDIEASLSRIDSDNKNKIIEAYKKDFPSSDINIGNFEIEIKNNFDDFLSTDISDVIRSSINSAVEDAAYEKIIDSFMKELSNFGNPRIYNENILLRINLYDDIIKNLDPIEQKRALKTLEQMSENFEDSEKDSMMEEFFENMVEEDIISPERLFIDLDYIRYDSETFNEILSGLLS